MKKTKTDTFLIINSIILILLSFSFVFPFIVIISTSFVGAAEAAAKGGYVLIPQKLDFSAYAILLGRGSAVYRAYLVTIFRVVVGSAFNLVFTATFAYVLAQKDLLGRKAITIIVFFTMIFSGGLVPTFLLIRGIGLYNSVWSLILPLLVDTWFLLIMRNFFMEIPVSLQEAAELDGASPWVTLIKVILPLSLPAMATIGLFYAVEHWNTWLDALIYLEDVKKYPVQLILRRIILASKIDNLEHQMASMNKMPPGDTVKSAAIVVTTIPILLIYPFIQKYFVKGVMVGSIKG